MKNGEDLLSRMVHPVGSAPYRRGYDPTLFYIDGREYCFEEVRAARLGHVAGLDDDDAVIINANARLKALEQEKKRVSKQGSTRNSAAELKKRKDEEEARKRKVKEEKLKRLEEEELALARMKKGLASPGDNSDKQDIGTKRRREDAPVAAQAKITSFMGAKETQPAPSAAGRQSKKSRTSISARDDDTISASEKMDHRAQRAAATRSPTLTVHTKNALDKVMNMFGDQNNQTLSMSSKGSNTPTMTINTKTAHAAVASMFSAPLSFDNQDDDEEENPTAELDSKGRGRENIPPSKGGRGQEQRKRGPLAVHQPEKKITYGDMLKESFGRGSAYGGPSEGGKKTNADAIREALENQEEEEEETQEYIDTVSLSAVKRGNRTSSVGFQIYEDLDADLTSPPKPRRLEMKTDEFGGSGGGERDESYLAALDDTHTFDADQSTVFGISSSPRSATPMRGAALKVFEDVEDGSNSTRDLSLSNIRCFVDIDTGGAGHNGTQQHHNHHHNGTHHNNGGMSPIKIQHISASEDDGDLTRGGGGSPSFFSNTHNNSSASTGSFTGFTPSPSRHTSTANGAGRNSSANRNSRRTSVSGDQGMTPLTFRKGFEPHAAPPRTPFAPKNENLLTRSPTKTPSPLKKQQQQPGQALVDPYNITLMTKQLAALEPQYQGYTGYIDCTDEKAPGARILKVPKGRRVSMGGLDPALQLRNCPPLEVERRIGEGAFATVHLVERTDVDPMFSKPLALKVQEPPCAWEWYIYNQIQQRVTEELLHCFVKFHSLHMYKDKSLILMDYYTHSLQDLISLYRVSGKPMDEVLVIYYTIEMMKTLQHLHKAGIIHGDLKPDNWLVRNDPCEYWDNWGTGVQGGWNTKGILLIDYGKSVDMSLYAPGTRFTGGVGADTFTCVEMKDGKPWTYQVDYFALLGVVHCLLHSNYMDIVQYKDGSKMKWKPRENFKRYWQSDKLWKPLFDALLNVEDCDHQPDLDYFIKTFEEYLVSSRKGLSVRTLLSKQGIMLHENQSKTSA